VLAAGVAIAALVLVFRPPPPDHAPTPPSSAGLFDSGICQDEAVLLVSEQDVMSQPGGDVTTTLSADSAVYLCDVRNGFQRVVYPQPGTRADCSTRQADFCEPGYIAIPFETLQAG